ALLAFLRGQLQCRGQAHRQGDWFRARSALLLLVSPEQKWPQTHAAPDQQGTDARGTMELVRADRQGGDAEGVKVDGDLARGCRGIAVKSHVAAQRRYQLLDRL